LTSCLPIAVYHSHGLLSLVLPSSEEAFRVHTQFSQVVRFRSGAFRERSCSRQTTVKTSVLIALSLILPIIFNYCGGSNQLHGADTSSRNGKLCSYSRTSQHFMELESSLPCSQEPYTGPYPEPDQSSPCHAILSQIHFNIIHPPTSWSS
jgi:hypothetical protein